MEGARYLVDGKLTVFRRAGIYYARLRLAGSSKYITRSLKTSDEQTAVDSGRRLLFQLEQRLEQGLPPKSKTFGAVIDHYIAYRERDHRQGKTSAGMLRQIVRVSKFWHEYAGHLAVEAIDDKVMRKQRKNYRLVVRGKTGERDAIVRSVAAKRLDKYLAKRRVADSGGLLFVMPDGSQITSLIDQLNSALKEAGIERNSFGEKYSVYSLRHFYAVNALRSCIGVFEVARNMGTSVQMIQEYCGKQATSAVFATRLGD